MLRKLFGRKPSVADVGFEPFYDLLVPAIVKIVAEARGDAPPYAFVLTHTGRFDRFGCHMMDEVALAPILAKQAERESASDPSYSRWFWGEWGPGHEFIGDLSTLAPAEAWVAQEIEPLFDAELDATRAAMREAVEEVLRRVDLSGAFGNGAAREAMLIYPMNQDGFGQDWTLAAAERLNPPAAWARYGSDFASWV